MEFRTRTQLPAGGAGPAGSGQATRRLSWRPEHIAGDKAGHARALCLAEQRAMHALELVRAIDQVLDGALRGFELVRGLAQAADKTPDSARNPELQGLLCEIGRGVNEARAAFGAQDAEPIAIEIPVDRRQLDEFEHIELGLPDLQTILFDSDGFGDLDLGIPGAGAVAAALCATVTHEIREYRSALRSVATRIETTLQELAGARRPSAPDVMQRVQAGLRKAAVHALRAQSKLSPRAVMLLESR